MKILFAALCLSALAFAQAGTPTGSGGTEDSSTSLTDAAKRSREAKAGTAKKVYTNDDIPSSGGVSVVGGSKQDPFTPPPVDAVQQQKMTDSQWHSAIAQQKALIANLENQLNVAEQNQARATRYYTVNGNPRYEKYKEQVDSLKQQIEAAKQQLADTQDEAHKAGADKAYD